MRCVNGRERIIGYFTVVCLVTWPVTASEAEGDLALIQTSLLFSCKCQLVSIRTTWFTQQKQSGLYQNKITSSLAAIQRPGHWTDNNLVLRVFSQGKDPGNEVEQTTQFVKLRACAHDVICPCCGGAKSANKSVTKILDPNWIRIA